MFALITGLALAATPSPSEATADEITADEEGFGLLEMSAVAGLATSPIEGGLALQARVDSVGQAIEMATPPAGHRDAQVRKT